MHAFSKLKTLLAPASRTILTIVVSACAFLAVPAAGLAQTYTNGDRILYANPGDTGDGAWYRIGVFWSIEGDRVRFDYSFGDEAYVPLTQIMPFDWAVGTQISCSENDPATNEPVWAAGLITSISMANALTSYVTIQRANPDLPYVTHTFLAYDCTQWRN